MLLNSSYFDCCNRERTRLQ